MAGFVKLYRNLSDHWVNQNSQALHLWTNILLEATHRDRKILRGKQLLTLKPGQLPFGARWFQEKTGIPKSTISRLMQMFESDGMITYERSEGQVFSIVTVCNWSAWQGRDGNGTVQTQEPCGLAGSDDEEVGQNRDGSGTVLGRTQEGKECKEEAIADSTLPFDEPPPGVVTTEEREVLAVLKSIPNWKFDYEQDLSFLRELATDFPSIALLDEAKNMRAWLVDKPLKPKSNARLRWRNWCKKAEEFGRTKQTNQLPDSPGWGKW